MREYDGDYDLDLDWDSEDSEESEEMNYNVASVQLSEIPLKYIEKYLRTKFKK